MWQGATRARIAVNPASPEVARRATIERERRANGRIRVARPVIFVSFRFPSLTEIASATSAARTARASAARARLLVAAVVRIAAQEPVGHHGDRHRDRHRGEEGAQPPWAPALQALL